jgi:hypothetical protein
MAFVIVLACVASAHSAAHEKHDQLSLLQTRASLSQDPPSLEGLEGDELQNEIDDETKDIHECAKWCHSRSHKDKSWEGLKCNWNACSECSECVPPLPPSPACPSNSVAFEGNCYATRSFSDPQSDGPYKLCENTPSVLPAGWELATYSDALAQFLNEYTWDTISLALKNPHYPQFCIETCTKAWNKAWGEGCKGSGAFNFVYEDRLQRPCMQGDQYSTPGCTQALIITKPQHGKKTMPAQPVPACPRNSLLFEDNCYATRSFGDPLSTTAGTCEDTPSVLPLGWELATYSDALAEFLNLYSWDTYGLLLQNPDDSQYCVTACSSNLNRYGGCTSSGAFKYVYADRVQTACKEGDEYLVTGCTSALIITKPRAV